MKLKGLNGDQMKSLYKKGQMILRERTFAWRVFLLAGLILIVGSLSLIWTIGTATALIYSAVIMWTAWSIIVLTVAIAYCAHNGVPR